MFITWDDTKTTARGQVTKRGTVQTRGASANVYHVTSTQRPGKALASITIKRGGARVASGQLVPAGKENGYVLAMIRQVEAGGQIDAATEVDAPAPAVDSEDVEADAAPELVGPDPVDIVAATGLTDVD